MPTIAAFEPEEAAHRPGLAASFEVHHGCPKKNCPPRFLPESYTWHSGKQDTRRRLAALENCQREEAAGGRTEFSSPFNMRPRPACARRYGAAAGRWQDRKHSPSTGTGAGRGTPRTVREAGQSLPNRKASTAGHRVPLWMEPEKLVAKLANPGFYNHLHAFPKSRGG